MEERNKTREQLAAELKACRRELALLKQVADAVERMQVGVTIRDTAGKIVYVNSTEAEMHGYKPEELLGKYVGILAPRELTDPLTVEKMKQMKNWSRESVNIHTDGTTFPVRLISDILTDAQGTPTGIVTICEDISERKEQEEQLIQADKMISLGTLLVGMAHEINNPNNFILLNSEFLSAVWDDLQPILDRCDEINGDFLLAGMPFSEAKDKISKAVADILEGSRRIKELISELKHFTRPEHSLRTDDVDINEVVKSAISLVDNQIRRCTDRFTVQYGRKLPSIRGNVQRLQQVVFNLLLNSCQALTDKRQRIFVSTDLSQDRRFIEVVVKDEGSGIPPDLLKRVWDPFFTTKREHKSSGLGLSICDSIIRSHQGNIAITSKTGRGTVVTVRLPKE